MKLDAARQNMLSQQIRACNVQDDHLINVISNTPRELFVPDSYRGVAFSDWNIPLGHEQVMMTPKDEANCLQSLSINEQDCILEVGTGSGYLTALLAKLGKYVYSIDIFEDFIDKAKHKLETIQLHNFTLTTADASLGWDKYAPYDVICLTASCPTLDQRWLDLLADNGRLFAIIGHEPAMHAAVFEKNGTQINKKTLYETVIPPMINANNREPFQF